MVGEKNGAQSPSPAEIVSSDLVRGLRPRRRPSSCFSTFRKYFHGFLDPCPSEQSHERSRPILVVDDSPMRKADSGSSSAIRDIEVVRHRHGRASPFAKIDELKPDIVTLTGNAAWTAWKTLAHDCCVAAPSGNRLQHASRSAYSTFKDLALGATLCSLSPETPQQAIRAVALQLAEKIKLPSVPAAGKSIPKWFWEDSSASNKRSRPAIPQNP